MKLSHLLVGTFCLIALGCSKPKAYAAAEEWKKIGDTDKEDLCKSLSGKPAALIPALQGWIKDATPKIEAKSKEFAAAIGELKDKGEFEKLKTIIDGFQSREEPCDKEKADFSPEELKAYGEINIQVQNAAKAAADAYKAKGDAVGVPVDVSKFRP